MNIRNLCFIFLLLLYSAQIFAAHTFPAHIILKTVNGQEIDIDSYKGNTPVYIKFWATWCMDCMKQMPHLEATQKKYKGKIKIIAVNLGVNDDQSSVSNVIKKFNLSMDVVIDKDGELAQKLNLIGTPYHVVVNRVGQVVYKGYVDTNPVDDALQKVLLENGKQSPNNAQKHSVITQSESINSDGLQAVYYFATWCDWYLKSSRPNMSQQCVRSQILINELSSKNKKIKWRGVATRLWTNEEDVRKYAHKFNVSYPLEIDTTNQEIFASRIRVFPTLVLLENGKEIYRTTAFDETEMCKSRTELCKQQG